MSNSSDALPEYDQYDSEEQKQYRGDTAFAPTIVSVADAYLGGTIPIDDDLARQIVYALQSRIDATKDQTEERVARIDQNFALREQRLKPSDANWNTFFAELYCVVEKWVDNLYLIFHNIEDNLDVSDAERSAEEYVAFNLEANHLEESSKVAYLKQMESQLAKQENIDLPPTTYTYWFKRADIIKSFLKWIIDKSQYNKRIEDFLDYGVTSGQFCYKHWPKPKREYKLRISKNSPDKESQLTPPRFSYDVEKKDNYEFIPKDTRNLIFRVDGFEDGVIEKVKTRFSELLFHTVGDDGKPLKNASYDYDQMEKLKKYLIKNEIVPVKSDVDQVVEYDEFDESEIQRIDGDIDVYEGHWISLKLPAKYTGTGRSASVKCLISAAIVGDAQLLFPIRAEVYPQPENAYKHTYFIKKDNNCAGIGLPELLEELQRTINELVSFSVDLTMFAVYGVWMGDKNMFEDPNGVQKIKPRQFVALNIPDGGRVQDYIHPFMPQIEVLTSVNNFVAILVNLLQRMSRQGPSGDKLSPDPTATEASEIYKQLEKSVDRTALRVNEMLVDFLNCGYVYYMQKFGSEDQVNLSVDGFRILTTESKIPDVNLKNVSRSISLDPSHLYLEDFGFEIKAIENLQKQSVERQQYMQFLNLANTVGFYDPATGTTRKFKDEMGQEWEVNVKSLLSRGASQYGIPQEDLWKKVDAPITAPPMPQTNSTLPSPMLPSEAGGVPTPSTPPLNSSPTTQAILNSVPSPNV